MKRSMYDLEVYPNYMCCGIQLPDDKVKLFEAFGENTSFKKKDIKKIHKLIDKYKFVGFNSMNYDDPVLAYMLDGEPCDEVHHLSKALVEEGLRRWEVYNEIGLDNIVDSIDIMDVARGNASLKLYGARLGVKKLQDLPFLPHTKLSRKEADEVADYNGNDLILTKGLYDHLHTDLKLRETIGKKYNINVMSFNGAKVAEAILLSEIGYTGKRQPQPNFIQYIPPEYIKFKTPELKTLFKKIISHKFLIMNKHILNQIEDDEYTFLLDDLGIEKSPKERYGKKSKKTISDSGNIILPDFLDKPITIDGVDHKLGLGGVHGSVISTTFVAGEDEVIVDIDYKSLYPSLKIINKFYPKHLGEKYLEVYAGMYHTRNNVLKPKLKTLEKGSKEYQDVYDEQDIMKLVLNSSFGKEGEKFSKLFDPSSLLHTTLTGQLTLMMVIEKLHLKGLKTFYANTDGITLKIKKDQLKIIEKITKNFDKKTGLEMEYNFFKSSHVRDVNNFVNVLLDEDEVKSKGAFGEPSIEKNSEYPIVFKAIRDYLLSGKPFDITLQECKDINQFCSSRSVTGGALYGTEKFPNTEEYDKYIIERRTFGLNRKQNKALEKRNVDYQKDLVLASSKTKYLGKVVRWYYSEKGKGIYYKKSGNKVPKTDGCKPMMELSNKLPKDLDYAKYNELCQKHLHELGV